jgi:protein-S-isoprenylcysteine O-methyltransferase Ste14
MKVKTSETFFPLVGTLLFLLFVLPIFLVWIPRQIVTSPEHMHPFDIGDARYLGLVVIPIGILLYLWCAIGFVFSGKGTPILFTPTKKLIVTGPYRWVRNPMYIAGVFVLAGEALLF